MPRVQNGRTLGSGEGLTEGGMQQTAYVLQQLAGALAPGEWTARTCYDLGGIMRAYLRANPSPPGAELAAEFEQWAANLEARGRERLEGLQQPPRLSVVPLRRP